jgi:YbgC/YbaW family acyl-CoA thioester hydrolase
MNLHRYRCHVRFSDVDIYGHVNNVKYFEYYQEARIAFVGSLGGDGDASASLFAAGSTDRQVVARIDVDYRRPILFRPEPYVVETWVTRIGTSSYDLSCRIVDGADSPDANGPDANGPDPNGPDANGSGPDGDVPVYSRAEVRLVTFDVGTQRSRPLSAAERERLERLLTT